MGSERGCIRRWLSRAIRAAAWVMCVLGGVGSLCTLISLTERDLQFTLAACSAPTWTHAQFDDHNLQIDSRWIGSWARCEFVEGAFRARLTTEYTALQKPQTEWEPRSAHGLFDALQAEAGTSSNGLSSQSQLSIAGGGWLCLAVTIAGALLLGLNKLRARGSRRNANPHVRPAHPRALWRTGLAVVALGGVIAATTSVARWGLSISVASHQRRPHLPEWPVVDCEGRLVDVSTRLSFEGRAVIAQLCGVRAKRGGWMTDVDAPEAPAEFLAHPQLSATTDHCVNWQFEWLAFTCGAWLPVMLGASAAALLFWSWLKRYRRDRRNACPSCGYNLTGNMSGRCPECGADTPNANSASDAEAAGTT